MIRKEDHIREVESLLVRIANPSGNKTKGKLEKQGNLQPLLKDLVTAKVTEEIAKLFDERAKGPREDAGKKARGQPKRRRRRRRRPLRGFFPSDKTIHAIYRGETHKARGSRRSGMIRFRGKSYNSPSMAARSLTGRSVNGWMFFGSTRTNRETCARFRCSDGNESVEKARLGLIPDS